MFTQAQHVDNTQVVFV